MNQQVIASLVTRRAELAGEMHTLQTRLHQVHADLAALDDVIKQFDPDYQLETIRPRYRREATSAETASISRAVLDALRRAGEPMAVKAIAEKVMAERGLDQADKALCRTMVKRVGMALRYQRTNGMVSEAAGDGGSGGWGLAD